MHTWLLAGTAFLASAAEAVEALTAVLAVALTRSWRSALSGAAWGLAAIIAIVAILGPALITDRTGFLTSSNAVLLEGLEVAVIVVAAAGFALRKPAARVPENTTKYVAGIMLTSFGTFWTGEGLGIAWWQSDLSLLWIIAAYLGVSAATVALMRRLPFRHAVERV